MPTTFATPAPERGTYVIDLTFKDETGALVVPTAATWSLTDTAGTIINSRSSVTISPLASTATLVLSGLDLAIGAGLVGTYRKLIVEFSYNSSLGSNLPMKEEFTFQISDFVKPTGIT